MLSIDKDIEYLKSLIDEWRKLPSPNDEVAGFHYEVISELFNRTNFDSETPTDELISALKNILDSAKVPNLDNENIDYNWLVMYWKTSQIRQSATNILTAIGDSIEPDFDKIIDPKMSVSLSKYAYEVGVIKQKIVHLEEEVLKLSDEGDKGLTSGIRVSVLGVSTPLENIKKITAKLSDVVGRQTDRFQVGQIATFLREIYKDAKRIWKSVQESELAGLDLFNFIVKESAKALELSLKVIEREKIPDSIPVNISRDKLNGVHRLPISEMEKLRIELLHKYGIILEKIRKGVPAEPIASSLQQDFRRVSFCICVSEHTARFVLAWPTSRADDLRTPITFSNENIKYVLSMTLSEYLDVCIQFFNDSLGILVKDESGEINLSKYKGIVSLKRFRE